MSVKLLASSTSTVCSESFEERWNLGQGGTRRDFQLPLLFPFSTPFKPCLRILATVPSCEFFHYRHVVHSFSTGNDKPGFGPRARQPPSDLCKSIQAVLVSILPRRATSKRPQLLSEIEMNHNSVFLDIDAEALSEWFIPDKLLPFSLQVLLDALVNDGQYDFDREVQWVSWPEAPSVKQAASVGYNDKPQNSHETKKMDVQQIGRAHV